MTKTNEEWTEEQWNEWGIFFNLVSEVERANLIRIKLIAEKDKEREEAEVYAYKRGFGDGVSQTNENAKAITRLQPNK